VPARCRRGASPVNSRPSRVTPTVGNNSSAVDQSRGRAVRPRRVSAWMRRGTLFQFQSRRNFAFHEASNPTARFPDGSGILRGPVRGVLLSRIMSAFPFASPAFPLIPPFAQTPGRTRYRITLECGCFWWEDRDASAPMPAMNMTARCYASHTQPPSTDPRPSGSTLRRP